MGLRIQHNIAALNTHRQLTVTDRNLSKSIERLSSGYRINHAADDAAGLAISERFRAQIASLRVAQRNVAEANSLLQVAEGGMEQINNILVRMKELATQAASGNVGNDVSKLSSEYNQLVAEIDRIVDSTKYANKNLIDGTFKTGNTTTSWDDVDNIYDVTVSNAVTGDYTVSYSADANELTITNPDGDVSETVTLSDDAQTVNFSTLGITFKTTEATDADTLGAALDSAELSVTGGSNVAFQVGYSEANYDSISITISNLETSELGIAADDISTSAKAQEILDDIETAISTVAEARGNIGAYQNRLYYAASNVAVTVENFTASESVIRDVDMAAEMTTFTKNQILLQAGTAMLAQANVAPQQVLALFQ